MAVDYDVVVIGSGTNALLLAERAAKLKARVGLVTLLDIVDSSQIQQLALQVRNSSTEQKISVIKREISFNNFIQQLHRESDFQERLETLRFLGVDVILEAGQFRDRHTFITSKRQLTSRTFVLAFDSPPAPLRKILGLQEFGYLTYEQILNLEYLPESLAILGGDRLSCILAQALNRLGIKISLLTDRNHILADFDVEAARILQAQMEVEGIEIYTGNRVTAVSRISSEPTQQLRLWAGNYVIDCEQILYPQLSLSTLTDLNFDKAGIRLHDHRIKLNKQLQTTNQRVYFCQYRHEINLILHNISSIFAKSQNPNHQLNITNLIPTEPELACFGMTEISARLKYGKDLYVLKQDSETESYKVLCRRNGEIIGASILGARAQELISAVAIAQQHKLKVSQLAEISDLVPSAITQLAQVHISNLKPTKWLESWFDFRRELNF